MHTVSELVFGVSRYSHEFLRRKAALKKHKALGETTGVLSDRLLELVFKRKRKHDNIGYCCLSDPNGELEEDGNGPDELQDGRTAFGRQTFISTGLAEDIRPTTT